MSPSERGYTVPGMRLQPVVSRIPPPVADVLRMNAEDAQRTFSEEIRLWAQFGAAAVVHSGLYRAGVEATPEVVEARAASAADMSRYLHQLLPHAVEWEPELPAMSLN